MLTCFFAVKGGSGTTTTAAAAAAMLARHEPVGLLDYGGGDILAALGVPSPMNKGDCVDAGHGITVWPDVPLSESYLWSLALDDRRFVADMGTITDPRDARWAMMAHAQERLLVIRPCYLALRRAMNTPAMNRPTGVVMLAEVNRALTERDIAEVLGVPVVASIPVDPAVARAVDAGLLLIRLPSLLSRPLEAAITQRIAP